MGRLAVGSTTGSTTGSTAAPILTVFLVALMVAACTPPPTPRTTVAGPEGRIEVLGPGPDFNPDKLSGDWAADGIAGTGRVTKTLLDGVPALHINGAGDDALLLRRTDATLIVSPYLSWTWRIDAGKGKATPTPLAGPLPVRMVVGFLGGRPKKAKPGGIFSSDVPLHDRQITLVWQANPGTNSLETNSLGTNSLGSNSLGSGKPVSDTSKPGKRLPDAAHHTVRSGRKGFAAWQLETVDLAALYKRYWPADRIRDVHIAYIGFNAKAGEAAIVTHLGGVVLMR